MKRRIIGANGTEYVDPSLPIVKREKIDDDDTFACLSCGATWLEQVPVRQYSKTSSVLLGQQPRASTYVFYLIRCICCGEIYEPEVQSGTGNDRVTRSYYKLIELLEKRREANEHK